MKQRKNQNQTFFSNILLNMMVFVITMAIIYMIPMEDFVVRLLISILFGTLTSFFVGLLMSINTRLMKLSIHDEVTGLYNGNFLSECKYRTISTTDRQQAKLGLMIISFQQLNAIKNTFDKKTSKAIIRYVGEGITLCSRATEYIFHLEDDTFLIFYADINEYNNIKVIKNRLNDFFEKPFLFGSQEYLIKLNYGYAVYPDDGVDFDSVMSVAKQRMYVEKSRE